MANRVGPGMHLPRLEHEGQRVVDLVRRELGRDRAFASSRRRAHGRSCRLCSEMPPGAKPLGLGVVLAMDQAHALVHDVAMEPGRAERISATSQRGGKITKSTLAVPAASLGEVSTVKIDGSGWSKLTVPIALKRARSYL